MLSVLSRIQFVKNCTYYRNRKNWHKSRNISTFLSLSLELKYSMAQVNHPLSLETKEITGLALNLLTYKNHSNSLSLSLSLSSTLPPLKKPMKVMDTLLEATTMTCPSCTYLQSINRSSHMFTLSLTPPRKDNSLPLSLSFLTR